MLRGNNRLSILRTPKIIEHVFEFFSMWLFQFKFVYFTHFLLAVLKSINLVLYRLRDNLFNLSHSLILRRSMLIENSTFPFSS